MTIISVIAILSSLQGFSNGYFMSYLLLIRVLFSTFDKNLVTRIQRRGNIWPNTKLIRRLKIHIHLQWVYLIWAILAILALTYQTTNSDQYDGINSISKILILFDLVGSLFQLTTLAALHINPYWGLVIINITQMHAGAGDGGTIEEINSIPVCKYKSNSVITVGERNISTQSESMSCPICITEYRDNEDIRVMACDHFAHKDCIDEWYHQQFNCVICRYDLRTGTYPVDADNMDNVDNADNLNNI